MRAFSDMPRASVEHLRQLAVTLQDGGESERWLARCLQQFFDRAERGSSIEEALDLSPAPGGQTWIEEEYRGQRDAVFRAMAQHFWPEHRPGGQAREIERRSLRYAGSAWRFDRESANMPEHYRGSELEYLWRAFKAGAPMPIKQRQLETILTAENRDRAA